MKATKCYCKSCCQDRVSDLRLRGAKEKYRRKIENCCFGDPNHDVFRPPRSGFVFKTEDKIFIASIRSRIRILSLLDQNQISWIFNTGRQFTSKTAWQEDRKYITFWAALVVTPAASLGVVALMTPTATV